MGFVDRATGWVRRLKTGWKEFFIPKPIDKEARVFLVRHAEDDFPQSRSLQFRDLTPAGEEQAEMSGLAIQAALAGADVVVLSREDDPVSYLRTAAIIARTVGVDVTVRNDLAPPPGDADLGRIDELGGTVVMVLNGTHLGQLLRELPGPDVPMGVLGPAPGSVHEMRIYYELEPFGWGFAENVRRRFV